MSWSSFPLRDWSVCPRLDCKLLRAKRGFQREVRKLPALRSLRACRIGDPYESAILRGPYGLALFAAQEPAGHFTFEVAVEAVPALFGGRTGEFCFTGPPTVFCFAGGPPTELCAKAEKQKFPDALRIKTTASAPFFIDVSFHSVPRRRLT
jgi:hypothetical protein